MSSKKQPSIELVNTWLLLLFLTKKLPRHINQEKVPQIGRLISMLTSIEEALQKRQFPHLDYQEDLSKFLLSSGLSDLTNIHAARRILEKIRTAHPNLLEKVVLARSWLSNNPSHTWWQLSETGQNQAEAHFSTLHPEVQTILNNELTESLHRFRYYLKRKSNKLN